MFKWNEFLWPFVIINCKNIYIATLVIQSLADPGVLVSWGTVFAASTLTVVPLIILLFQRKLVSGIMSGFMKF